MDDQEQIRQLVMTGAVLGDRVRIAALGELFTEEAVWETPFFRAEGRAAIVAQFSGGGAKPAEAPEPQEPAQASRPSFTRHHITTCMVETDGPDTASARSYYMMVSDTGPEIFGFYADKFARGADGWRFTHRKAAMDWISPASPNYERLKSAMRKR